MATLKTSLYQCRIPCEKGDIVVHQLDKNSWWLDLSELCKGIGLKEKEVLATIKEIVADNPDVLPNPMVEVRHLQIDENDECFVKTANLVSLQCAVGVLTGEAVLGNQVAQKLVTETLYFALVATFENLAMANKEETQNECN